MIGSAVNGVLIISLFCQELFRSTSTTDIAGMVSLSRAFHHHASDAADSANGQVIS